MSAPSPAGKWTIWLSLAVVSTTAAVASYLQALRVVQAADGQGVVTYFVAALADPTIFAASANILDARRRGLAWPRWSLVSVAVALVVTGGLNVAAGWPHAVPPWLVRLWPPVAFLMALESLSSYIRRGRGGAVSATVPATSTPCPHTVALSGEEAAVMAYRHSLECLGERLSYREIERRFGVKRDRVAELADPPAPEPVLNGQAHGD